MTLMSSKVSKSHDLPKVVIVGRPNVGKSALMNRILQRREAIVEDEPGITRDRKAVETDWAGRDFLLVDTGGWSLSDSELDTKVSSQALKALDDADVIIFVVDTQVGLTDLDLSFANNLRGIDIPVILAANKSDTTEISNQAWEFMNLGFGEPHPISSIHGMGVADMLDDVVSLLPEVSEPEEEQSGNDVFSVVIVGRPNVGKSTLFNNLIGEDRSIVHDLAGTTRDTIDTTIDTPYGKICFLDTAGMRKKSKINEDAEFYSALRALKSVDKADLALLVIDASVGVTQQDQRLAERVDAAGCPIVIVLNKIDKLNEEQKEDLNNQILRRLSFLPSPVIHRIVAVSGKGVNKILPSLYSAVEAYRSRIPTKDVNKIVRLAQQAQPAPGGARILYAMQGATDPPTFTLFSNRKIHDTYLRYIEKQLRDSYDLGSTPIKLRVRLRNE